MQSTPGCPLPVDPTGRESRRCAPEGLSRCEARAARRGGIDGRRAVCQHEEVKPSPQDPRKRLTELRNELLKLHTVLLHSERALYERDTQRIRSSRQFLDLALNDPAFAWLRVLSQFVVLIDETLEAEEAPSAAEASRAVRRAHALLSPVDTSGVFEKSYLEALQRDPDAILAHAAALKVLRRIE